MPPNSSLTRLAPQAPRLATLALALLGAGWVAVHARALLRSPSYDSSPLPAPPMAAAPARAPLDVPGISALNLFGKFTVEQKVDTAALPNTTLSLKLFGIISSTQPELSRSLIAADGKPAKTYFKGDALPGGATLHSIDSRFVVVQRGEQLEKLPLHGSSALAQAQPRRLSPAAAIVEAAPAPAPAVSAQAAPMPQTVYKELEDRLAAIRQRKRG